MIPIISDRYPSFKSPVINPASDSTLKSYNPAAISIPTVYFPVDSVLTVGKNTFVIVSSVFYLYCFLYRN